MLVGEYILLGLLLASALFLIVAVTLQKSGDEGLSGTIAGGSSDTYYGKDQSQNKEKLLGKWTVIVTVIFAIAVLAVYVLQPDYGSTTDIYGDSIDYESWQDFAGEYSSMFGE